MLQTTEYVAPNGRLNASHMTRFVDTKLRPIAVNPREVLDQEAIYVDGISDHILLQIGEKKVRITKHGAKELVTKLLEQI